MLYIATIHFQTDKWTPIQLRYLKKHTTISYKLFACLPPFSEYKSSFYFQSDYESPSVSSQNHADKLNFLATQIQQEANDDDLLIFLDGDAFPIQDYISFVVENLKQYPLIAIRRHENNDLHPHPSFCATTVGFWKKLKGDWSVGDPWLNTIGECVKDSGGNLLRQLENKHNWLPLLRSNKQNLHPLWFGIYADRIYHHGAGYRNPISRIDLSTTGKQYEDFLKSKVYEENYKLHEKIFNQISTDDDFYKLLITCT